MASIVEKRGKYSVVVDYKDKDGKRRQKWESFDTKKEAEAYKAKIEYSKSVGLPTVMPNAETVEELMKEFVETYGREKWSYSNYASNISRIRNYILPYIGKMKLKDVSPRWIENYYHTLLEMDQVKQESKRKEARKKITPYMVRNIHKLLHCAFGQAVRWEMIAVNPFDKVMTPKYRETPREIWELEDMRKALEACDDPILELCINLAFSCSLRLGEVLGLTWDCVHIEDELIEANAAWIYVDKQLQRVTVEAFNALGDNSVILKFPQTSINVTTRLVLKEPKTATSVRRIYLPRTVALLLKKRKELLDRYIEYLGDDYMNFNLVVCYENGTPIEHGKIRAKLNDLIKKNNLKPVVFHSLRHSSTTYKLKISGGDIKAVQGDTGHAEAAMITERYAHVLDDDRRVNAEKFEEMFYQDKDDGESKSDAEEVAFVIKKLKESPELLKLLKNLIT